MEESLVKMKFEDLIGSLNEEQPLPTLSVELQSLWWARKGNWEKAHQLAQDANSREGDWIHAYLHREEGDLGNAAYWYAQATQKTSDQDLLVEWEDIVKTLLRE
jgi:hypothetical protein